MANDVESAVVSESPAVPPPPRALRNAARRGRADDLSLRELGRAIADRRWTMVAVTLGALAAAAVYLVAAHPVYRSTMSLQVAEPPSLGPRLERLAPLLDPATPIEGDIEILRSRMVIGPVVDELGLDVVAEPVRFPLVGDAIARSRREGTPAAPPLPLSRLSRFGWGGERISVARLSVPDALLGEPLALVAGEHGGFRLALPSGRPVLEGRAGVAASGEAGGGRVELLVSELRARPGTEFRLRKLRRDDVVDALQERLWIEEKVKRSGVISVSLEGRDPARVASILGALSSAYLRQEIERRSAEAARKLEFLDAQLPKLRGKLESAEALLVAYRAAHQTVDLGMEARATVEWTAAMDAALADLEAEREALGRRYTPQHPDLRALDRKIAAMRAQRAGVEPRVRSAPGTQIGTLRLVREVDRANELYALLSNQAEMLRVAKAGTIGNVRLLDSPVAPRRPLRPRPLATVILALLAGLCGGAALIITRRVLDEAASDPQEIETGTGVPVFATVPHSAREAYLDRHGRAGREPLARDAPDDPAAESLRALHTALGFVVQARGNVAAVSSPSPGVGKTFVSVNLAHLAAAAGKRVLLVDADLRHGTVHRFLAAEAHPGLADVLAGEATLEQAIRPAAPRLDVLARGTLPELPAELLGTPRLQALLAAAAQRYDLVVVDTPPSLAVTDPLLVARCAGVNLLVLRAGRHPLREISLALERYARAGAAVHGAVLNGTKAQARRAGRSRRKLASGA